MAKKKFPKPTAEAPHQCPFCGRLFAREQTMFTHQCERKRRHMARDDRWVKLAYILFEKSYRMMGMLKNRSKPMSYDEFADNQFYNAYVKFARHVGDLGLPQPPLFVEYLVKNGVPLDNWCQMDVYEAFVQWMIETEAASVAVERNILFMEAWAEERGLHFRDFFAKISPGEALLLLKTGKLSPWMVFLSESGDNLFARMSPEQQGLLDQTISVEKWRRRFLARTEDVKWVREICKQAGL